jgi:hypothetical protein
VVLNLSGRTLLLLVGGLFSVVGLVFVYTGLHDARRERAYRDNGETVEAIVVAKSIERASRDGNSATKYEIRYRFGTPDGRSAEGKELVDVERWERLEPGSAFRITYLPDSPQTSRAAGESAMASAATLIALGSLLAAIGLGFLAWQARQLWREQRLLRSGLAARGTVLAIEPSNVTVNRVRQWIVRYRFTDHMGSAHEAASSPTPPGQAHALAVGDTVEVRFDAERPEDNVWIAPEERRPPSSWRSLRNIALVAALLLVALVLGETVPPLKFIDEVAARHEAGLTAATVGMAALGFLLFMGGILYRIFGGEGDAPTGADAEDTARRMNIDADPVAARVSGYRFRGRSAGASFADEFTLGEAKDAWRRGAWRTSARWRANFVVTAGALLFALGLFGFFVVGAPVGIKLLFVAAVVYAVVATVRRWARA